MKKYLTLLLLPVLLFSCKTAEPFTGDGDSTLVLTGTSTGDYRTTLPADSFSISILKDIYAVPADMANYRYLDTVKALLLCGDTARYYTGSDGWYEIDPQCYWIAGYIIIERFAAWAKFAWLFTPAEPTFLDRKKKPLEKTTLVWMVKELN